MEAIVIVINIDNSRATWIVPSEEVSAEEKFALDTLNGLTLRVVGDSLESGGYDGWQRKSLEMHYRRIMAAATRYKDFGEENLPAVVTHVYDLHILHGEEPCPFVEPWNPPS